MKRVKVLIPFIDSETGKLHKVGDEVGLSEATIERTKAISVNMVLVLEDVAEEPKDDQNPEDAEGEKPAEEPKKQTRKPRTKKSE